MELYRTLVESAGETIAMVDRSGTFLFMNKTAASRLGGTPDAYAGKSMWDLFPKAIADRQAGSVRKVIDTSKGLNVVVETEVQGQRRWYNTTIEPIRDVAGKITTALVMGRDIHELHQARQELDQYREKMCRAEQLASLGTLSATIAHEMTQPLTVSRLSLQEAMAELETAGGSPRVMESLKECLGGISDAAGRVERFRNFARQPSREGICNVRLQDVVARTVRLLEGKARERRVSLSIRNLSALPSVCADEKDIEQMCFALISNAIQAADGKRQRKLVISGHKHDGGVALRFEDTCGGIAPEHVDKIFQPFFTTKPYGEGTGLGLCVVDRVVTQAGGSIRVENRPGEGAAFCVTLPMQRPQA
jgi:two-component system C4-dicarboxylate transport sensor histidine kinase DctB